MKKVVKASGDGCVTGYVRFRKIKPCKGYRAAENRAASHLSKIVAGRITDNGEYAAVVRFRLRPLLIPFAAFMAVLGIIFGIAPQAAVHKNEKESTPEPVSAAQSAEYAAEPETVAEAPAQDKGKYAGLYISVPGYAECRISSENRSLLLYNPEGNKCLIRYFIYIQDRLVASTQQLSAGESEAVDLYGCLKDGQYSATLVAGACSPDGQTEFNSVSQQIILIKEEEK